MCYAFKQISYWYIYDFLLDILFLRVVTILGVHPSLQIYIIMISSTQNLIHLREVAYLVDILSFTSTLSLLCYFFGGSVKAFALSAYLISLHLDALLCGEDYFPHAYLYEAFAILIGIPRLDEAFIFYLHHGLSQAQVLYMLISKLVNPFASCVW